MMSYITGESIGKRHQTRPRLRCHDEEYLGMFTVVFGVMYVNVGVQLSFTNTAWFRPIVPAVLGDPTVWVLITGVMEIAIGVGLILPQTRLYAAQGSLVFLVGIYVANLNMWVNNIPLDGKTYASLARAPLGCATRHDRTFLRHLAMEFACSRKNTGNLIGS